MSIDGKDVEGSAVKSWRKIRATCGAVSSSPQ